MTALKFILLYFLPNACKNSDKNACNIRTCALIHTKASQQYSGNKYQYCGHYHMLQLCTALQTSWVQQVLNPRVKWSVHEADYSPPLNARDINEYSHYSLCSSTFMACIRTILPVYSFPHCCLASSTNDAQEQ